MPRRSLVNRTAARTSIVLRHMRCDLHVTALSDKFPSIKPFIPAYRDRMIPRKLLQHQQGCVPLRSARNPSDHTKLLTTSKTKLHSIEEIVRIEAGALKDKLRCAILTDFIRKAELPKAGLVQIFSRSKFRQE